jgi:hypothetical protein
MIYNTIEECISYDNQVKLLDNIKILLNFIKLYL